MKTNRVVFFLVLQWLCAFFVIGVLLWYLKFEPPVATYTNVPFPVRTSPVHAGDAVQFHVERVNHSESEVNLRVTRWLTNLSSQERIDMFATERKIPPGFSERDSDLVISKVTLPGMYTICGETRVPGTWRSVDVPWCTVPFEVIR